MGGHRPWYSLVFLRGTFEVGEPFSVEHRVAKQKRDCFVVLICRCAPKTKLKFMRVGDSAIHGVRRLCIVLALVLFVQVAIVYCISRLPPN
jgi:hypothetical protein